MPSLKPLSEQTIVITGASSGIGLATARRAAREGARVVLVARNEDALEQVVRSIESRGGQAAYVVQDMAEPGAAANIGRIATERFGGFDTWVNDAAVALYARLDETTMEEHRRVFDVGYFGVVEASLYAVGELRQRRGALINVGSVLSERSVPLQGSYSAMKHAVRGFTDALRMEVEMARDPVAVTLIKPNGIDTPYPEHARNKLGVPARIPPIVYDPELVAKAICFAAAHYKRELTVGGGGFLVSKATNVMPRAADRVMELIMGPAQTIDTPPEPGTNDNLFEPRRDGRERSNKDIYVRKTSLALEAQMRPLTLLVGIGATAAFAAFALGGAAVRRARRGMAAQHIDPAPYQDELKAGIADEAAVPTIATYEELVVIKDR